LNKLPEKARQFVMRSLQGIGLRNFFQKLLAIAPNDSVAAFFFFPLIQFVDSERKLEIYSDLESKQNQYKFIFKLI